MKKFFKALSALTMALCLTATALIPTGTASPGRMLSHRRRSHWTMVATAWSRHRRRYLISQPLPQHIQSLHKRNTATTMQKMFCAGPTRFTVPLSTMEPHWFPARIPPMRLPSTTIPGLIKADLTGKAVTPHMVKLHITLSFLPLLKQ